MTYSNTLHGYWFLGITVTILAINHFIIPVAGTYANLICLFLILSIGISHGSLDNLKGNKILKIYKIKNKSYILFILYSSSIVAHDSMVTFTPSLTSGSFSFSSFISFWERR